MHIEHEVKYLNIDKDDIRSRLRSAKALLVTPNRLMRRVVMDFPDRRLYKIDGKRNWVRVRDEGDKVTLTYKQIAEHVAGGSLEQEVIVSNYQTTIAIMQSIGLEVLSGQESYRETWQLGDVEVVIDEWPFIPPFIEIEGPDQKSIKQVAEILTLKWADACHGSVNIIYKQHFPKMLDNETIDQAGSISFNEKMPIWLQERR